MTCTPYLGGDGLQKELAITGAHRILGDEFKGRQLRVGVLCLATPQVAVGCLDAEHGDGRDEANGEDGDHGNKGVALVLFPPRHAALRLRSLALQGGEFAVSAMHSALKEKEPRRC